VPESVYVSIRGSFSVNKNAEKKNGFREKLRTS
jgi:hypothetical protein